MSDICYIAGSGDFTPRELLVKKGDFVIAADGGYESLTAFGISPHLLAGDLDSIEKIPENIETVRFPTVKDDTDMGLAIKIGIEKGFRVFRLYGGSGSRPDHFFANLQLLLRYADLGYDIKLICPEFTVHAVSSGDLLMKREKGTVFSVFSATDECRDVSIQNAKYVLSNEAITSRFPLGVSNEFLDKEVSVSVKSGVIFVFEYVSGNIR